MIGENMNIAILGLGTVGFGVYDIIANNDYFKGFFVTKVLDKDMSKKSLVKEYTTVTSNYDDILKDKDISVIVETMGAKDFSYLCIKRALEKGKSVITANKEVMSVHLQELTRLKEENGCSLYYEASVGGGIPIMASLFELVKINEVSKISGILNGTTNFILTKMFKEGISFTESIEEAKREGFAEADPTNDLEGLDMVRKISILSQIAYKAEIDINDIYHFGITNINDDDVKNIKNLGLMLKLVASSQIVDNNLSIQIEPVIIGKNNIFSSISYENNIIEVLSNINGPLSFIGKGAGRYPTANAICNDLISIIEKKKNYSFVCQSKINVCPININSQYYIRLKDNEWISNDLIEFKRDTYLLTKTISRKEFLEIVDKIVFYARIL